jgi:hypothetical protein
MLVFILILIGILLRLTPHAPNFTPVAAIALFGGAYLNKKRALIVPLLLMIISDLIIGLHNVVIFTWGSFILITFLGPWLKRHKNAFGIASMSLVSSFLFFIVSNFGVWLMGWYPHTLAGFINCYVMALSFLRDFTLGTLIYTTVFISAYELAARLVKDTKFAKVLLTN